MTSHQARKFEEGLKVPLSPKFSVISTIISIWKSYELWHIVQIGTHHFFFMSRHLESVRRTELIFELNECRTSRVKKGGSANFGLIWTIVVELLCSGYKLQRLCQGKAQWSQRANNRTEPFPGTIGRAI